MPTTTTDVFLVDELEDAARTSSLAEHDLQALRDVARWLDAFITKPHPDLGRPGPVCPFVPGSLERNSLWLAPVHIADQDTAHAVALMDGYKERLLDAEPVTGADAAYKVIVVVFTDLTPDRARGLFGDVMAELAVRSYVDHGVLFGPFYEGNEGTAIYNSDFRPFTSPVPFLFVRLGVVNDWKFFLNDDEALGRWGRRYGESAVFALAEELRRLPWNARRD
jgi:hypothetical protein